MSYFKPIKKKDTKVPKSEPTDSDSEGSKMAQRAKIKVERRKSDNLFGAIVIVRRPEFDAKQMVYTFNSEIVREWADSKKSSQYFTKVLNKDTQDPSEVRTLNRITAFQIAPSFHEDRTPTATEAGEALTKWKDPYSDVILSATARIW